MDIKELKQISKDNLDFVKNYYLENNKEFQPMIVIYAYKNNERVKITAILGNSKAIERRFKVLADLGIDLGVRTFLKKEYESVDAVFSLNEAWMSKNYTKEKIKEEDFVSGKILMPSEDPKHLEVLISAGLSSDNQAVADLKIIRKSWDGNKIVISFEGLDENDKKEQKEDEKIEVKSSLLESFWETFNIIKNYSEKVDENEAIKKEIKSKTSEELVDTYIGIFDKFIKDDCGGELVEENY